MELDVTGSAAIPQPELSRRGLLTGLAAVPALLAAGALTDALPSTSGLPVPGLGAGAAGAAGDQIARGGVRRLNAPWLAPGTRLRLPAGIMAAPVAGYWENRPRVGPAAHVWPNIPTADGAVVDASIIPERGAPSRMAILSGFKNGWYEISHPNGRTDRVQWDARQLPFLFYWGEFGGSTEGLFMDRFFTLGLEAFSRPPVR